MRGMDDALDDDLDEVPKLPPVEAAKPPYQAPPAGVPPLIPDPAGLEKVLGGKPIAMRVGRPNAPEKAPKSPAATPLAFNLSATFTGAPAGDPQLKAAIGKVRSVLGNIIRVISESETTLPEILDRIEAHPADALSTENFHIAEAKEFHAALIAALNTVRN